MTSAEPPKAATWLLRRFGSSPKNDSIIGDLTQSYRQGRSRIWYWRQVMIAIVSGAFTEICSHKLIGFRIVLLGLIVIHIVGNLMFNLYGRLIVRSLHGHLVGAMLITEGRLPFWVHWSFAAVVCIVGIVTGWTIARLHPTHQPAAVLLGASSILMYLFAFAMVAGPQRSPLSAGGSLAFYCLNSAIVFVGILVGGLFWSTTRPDATRPQGISS